MLPEHVDAPVAMAATSPAQQFVPKSIKHMRESRHGHLWRDALKTELANLSDSWHWTPLPPGKTACRQIAIFKAKLHADGSLDKRKVRICIDGKSLSRDEMGETYQAVATLDSVRLMASMAVQNGDDLIQCDFDAAFLCGSMPYELYARPPHGIGAPLDDNGEPQVCRVVGNQYGHPKAPNIFGTLCHEQFMSFCSASFPSCVVTRGRADICTYRFECDGTAVNCVLYVDDTLWQVPRTPEARKLFRAITDHINSHAKLRITADAQGNRRGQPVHSFLGVLFEHDVDKGVLHMSMPSKIDDLIASAGLSNANPKYTTGEPGSEVTLADCPVDGPAGDEHRAVMERVPYRSLLMSTMWIVRGVRPDGLTRASALSRVMHKPGVAHWRQLKHLLRYLKATRDEKLTYTRDDRLPDGYLPVWIAVDASYLPDYGDLFANYKSTTGWVVFGPTGQAVAWRSRRQSLTADSTCVAEYMAAADAVKMAVHMRRLLSDFGAPQTEPTVVWEDNQACIKFGARWCNHDRTKHVDVKAHLVRDMQLRDIVQLQHVSTDMQPADAMTKVLPRPATEKYRGWILRGCLPAPPVPAPSSAGAP